MNYEKVSVNVNKNTLALMDMLIEKGFFRNRSDLITQSITKLLREHSRIVKGILDTQSTNIDEIQWIVGFMSISKKFLETVKKEGAKLKFKGFGIIRFEKDVENSLIVDTVKSIDKDILIRATKEIERLYHK